MKPPLSGERTGESDMTSPDEPRPASELGRRQLLQGTLAAAAATAMPGLSTAGASEEPAPLRGRIRQSSVFWCFNSAGEKWDIDRTCQVARQLG
jgi:hypothetical protein